MGLTSVRDDEIRKLCTARSHASTAAVVNKEAIFGVTGSVVIPVFFAGNILDSSAESDPRAGNCLDPGTVFNGANIVVICVLTLGLMLIAHSPTSFVYPPDASPRAPRPLRCRVHPEDPIR